jgi:UbiD family decarboxylase
MGRPVEQIGADWLHAIDHPIPPIVVDSPPCQEVIITGDDLRSPGGGLGGLPVPISTPSFDAAPYLTATLCITSDPETRIRNVGTYRAALKKTDRLGVRMSSRIGGYIHWCKYRDRKDIAPLLAFARS